MQETGNTPDGGDDLGTGPPAKGYRLQLYIAGMNPRSIKALQSVKEFCSKHLEGDYSIEVIDIYRHPEKAREENLVVAPTLVKQLPPPLVRFIGDLSREEVLIEGMGVIPR